jgi:multiple sugar transport system permease protein
VPLSVIPALGLAMVLNSKLPGVNFFRAVYFLPSVAAVVGTALIWRWLYDPTIGFINYGITQLVNFLNSLGLQLVDPQIQWLTGPGVVLFSIVILSAWQVVGFNTVLFLAGLQGISKELYEASSIDGANRWETFWFITLPMLAPTTFFVIITTVITGLQVFNEPYALFPSRPIPENATTSVFYLYNQGFFRFNFGYASAIAWVLFALIFLMTLAQFRLQRSNAYEG